MSRQRKTGNRRPVTQYPLWSILFHIHMHGIVFALIAACSVVHSGCNEFHTPIDIDPKGEVPAGTQFIHSGNVKIRVPAGWTLVKVLRDDSGRAALITLACAEDRRRARGLDFSLFDSLPSETNGPDFERTSTARHKNFLCRVNVAQEPSGDDTPGRYEVSAYVQTRNEWWRMQATFTSPVRPDLAAAIDYIDALEVNDGGH